MALTTADFYKSMTTHADHRVWQDVYRPATPVGEVYLKLTVIVAVVIAIVLLKSLDAKFWGVVVMGGSVMILFFLPWLDHSKVKSIRYRPDWHKYVYAVFIAFFLVLGYLGMRPPGVWGGFSLGGFLTLDIAQTISQIGTLFYFGFFLLMPWWSRLGSFKPVPNRVTFVAH